MLMARCSCWCSCIDIQQSFVRYFMAGFVGAPDWLSTPGRAMPTAVRMACSVPTHSRTEWTRKPAVSCRNELDSRVAAFTHYVGGPEPPRELDAIPVAAEHDDLVCAKSPGGNHTADSHGAVADGGYGLARRD